MDILKIVIYLKDIIKPVVLTCSEEESSDKDVLIDKIRKMYTTQKLTSLLVDNGDIVMVRPEDIKAILITRSRDANGNEIK